MPEVLELPPGLNLRHAYFLHDIFGAILAWQCDRYKRGSSQTRVINFIYDLKRGRPAWLNAFLP